MQDVMAGLVLGRQAFIEACEDLARLVSVASGNVMQVLLSFSVSMIFFTFLFYFEAKFFFFLM